MPGRMGEARSGEALFEKQRRALLRQYQQAARELRATIAREGATGFQIARSRILLDQVNGIAGQLRGKTETWTVRQMPLAFEAGRKASATELQRDLTDFSLIHKRAVEAASRRITTDVASALHSVAPYIEKVWTDTQQLIIREETMAALVTRGQILGLTPKQLKQRIVATMRDGALERLKDSAVPAALQFDLQNVAQGRVVRILCRDGKYRNYGLDYYGDLVARTASRQVATEGSLVAALEFDQDLVRWSVHANACPRCLPNQGKIFSITGRNKDFPLLTDDKRTPLHPKCGHSLNAVDEDFLRERGEYDRLAEFSSNGEAVTSMADYRAMVEGKPRVAVPKPEVPGWMKPTRMIGGDRKIIQAEGDAASAVLVHSAGTVTDVRSFSPLRVAKDLKDAAARKIGNALKDDSDFQAFYRKHPELQRRLADYPLDYNESELAAANLISLWSATSADDSAMSIAMQLAARTEFGLTDTWMGKSWGKVAGITGWADEVTQSGMRKFLRMQYDMTQLELKRQGIGELQLVRGASWDAPIKGVKWNRKREISQRISVSLQPMSSFSSSIYNADTFARREKYRMVFAARVPAERVISIPSIGSGCWDEAEFIVLGGSSFQAAAVTWVAPTSIKYELAEALALGAVK